MREVFMLNYDQLYNAVPFQSNSLVYENFFDFFPPLIDLKTTPQDNIYHAEGDVWTHTKMVCNELLKLSEYQNASNDDKFVLFYSALLHDISKPACTKILENNRISSAGHSKMGAIDTRILLWKCGVPFNIREKICNIIEVHQLPFYAFHKNQNKKQRDPIFLGHLLSQSNDMPLLFTLAKADMLGRICHSQQDNLDNMEVFKLLCLEEQCFHNKKIFPDDFTRVKYFRSEGSISPDYPFYYEEGSKVIVMSGLPATGKDYWISQNHPNLKVIGFDLAEQELKLRHGDNNGIIFHHVQDQAKELLRKKEPFIFNATHIVKDLRDKTLDLLYAYNANVSIVYLEADYSTIMSRNDKRDTSLSNSHIEKMMTRWDVPKPIESHHFITHIHQLNKKTKTSP